MVTAAATLATLARETAEDIFDAMTADCSEPIRLERVRNNMPKYTTELVPTMPLPQAAAASAAAEAGDIAAWVARATAIEIERADAEARAASAEAERDRLSAENARLARQAAIERDAAKAAEAELAAVRGAMPSAVDLDLIAGMLDAGYPGTANGLRSVAARIRALATATPTPRAAEAVTGDVPPGGWRDPLAALDQPQEADHA